MNVIEIFCHVDDFCQIFEKFWRDFLLKSNVQKKNRPTSLALSEMITSIISFL